MSNFPKLRMSGTDYSTGLPWQNYKDFVRSVYPKAYCQSWYNFISSFSCYSVCLLIPGTPEVFEISKKRAAIKTAWKSAYLELKKKEENAL